MLRVRILSRKIRPDDNTSRRIGSTVARGRLNWKIGAVAVAEVVSDTRNFQDDPTEARLGAGMDAVSLPSRPTVAVILPSLNECNTISTVISKIRNSVPTATVVVVDGGSSDGTIEKVRSASATLVVERKRGYGRAVKTGIGAVNADFYVMLDADDTYDVSVLRKMLTLAKLGKVVLGRRKAGNGNMSFSHVVGNITLSLVHRIAYNQTIRDTQSGFKIFPATVAKMLKEDGMTLSSEIILTSRHLGIRIEEVEVSYRPRHENSESKFFFWKDGVRVLLFLLPRRLSKSQIYNSRITGRVPAEQLPILKGLRQHPHSERQ